MPCLQMLMFTLIKSTSSQCNGTSKAMISYDIYNSGHEHRFLKWQKLVKVWKYNTASTWQIQTCIYTYTERNESDGQVWLGTIKLVLHRLHKCLQILCLRDRLREAWIREQTRVEDIPRSVKKKKWQWTGGQRKSGI